ncbi:hypothetical protein MBANPS3_003663 [Mucor bainieri]
MLRDQLKSFHPNLHSVYLDHSNSHHHHNSCITMSGSHSDIQAAKSDLIRLQAIEITLSIHSLYPGLAYRNVARNNLHEQLKLIAIQHNIQIVADYNQIVIRLIGPVDRVELARIDVLLFFDHLLGLSASSLNMPLYTLNILGSRRHANILAIMEETGTHIYLPSPWTQPSSSSLLFNHHASASTTTTTTAITATAESESIIHVTGNTTEAVQRATMLLAKSLPQKMKTMCNSQSILNPRKRDWLLLYKRDELTKLMRDNGSFIVFPPFGSEDANQIQVFAENSINIERTLRTLNYLTSHIFQAVICVNAVQPAEMIARLSQDSGAQIMYRTDSSQFEMTGSKEQIQCIVQMMRSLPISQEQHTSVMFSIELALDQREFISGKKNGKINKIMKSCDADIRFQTFNDYNFVITIESEDFFKAKDGLDSLQNELPAEISFFVPEICHRRIIGVAGKNIQRVMKQYGVYVKFSSNEELATFGGYFENEHNVIARTPEKNLHSLLKLKSAVMEFITFQKDRDYVSRSEYVPYFTQRNLLYHNGKYLRDKGRLYNSKITWPERNGTDHVLVTGPQSHIEEMQLRIQSLLPQYVDIQVPASVALENMLKSPDMEELQHSLYAKTSIFLVLPDSLIMTSSMAIEEDDEIDDPLFRVQGRNTHVAYYDYRVLTFKLCYDANTKNQLPKARQMFDAFMNSRFVPVDDTLHHNALNGSPSPEDMRHISPSVMHHIDHPESYEQQQQQQQQQHFFANKKLPSKLRQQSLIDFFAPTPATSHGSKSSSTVAYDPPPPQPEKPGSNASDDFNVWASKPSPSANGLHNDPLRFSRANIPSTKSSQFYYPKPELKPNYSTSSANLYSQDSYNLFYQYGGRNSNHQSMSPHHPMQQQQQQQQHHHHHQQQQQQQQQQQHEFVASNTFVPVGYSRQRSTSLIPPGQHYQNHTMLHHNSQQGGGVPSSTTTTSPSASNTTFGPYPSFNLPSPTSRIGIGSTPVMASSNDHQHHYNNARFYPLDSAYHYYYADPPSFSFTNTFDTGKNPSSSLSTPIPVAVDGSNPTVESLSMQSIHSHRFNYY